MKTTIHFLAFFLTALGILPTQTFSQTYMIPDIGAPGMNIYVEMIAQHDRQGFFGADSVYSNNPGDNLRIVVDDPNAPIEIGPFIVSWDGRLISTQVFVREEALPNDFDWERLDNQWRRRIRVTRNGATVAEYPFFIVQPWPLGNITGINENVFGRGRLGKRSPRGTMIVDSLILRGGTEYTFSTEDCDPTTPGNQGYLPVILLAQGNIIGATGTVLNVSGTNGLGPKGDAGPGGGGGGGSYHDRSFTSGTNTGPIANGGDGFTGGGAGGQNRGTSLSGTQTYTNPGTGTGALGTGAAAPSGAPSLNRVPGGSVLQGIFENAGGGTGHPFGVSGFGSANQGDTRPGQFGGGSGASNDQAGGGAGYGTDGTSSAGSNGGREHGNSMIVPLAGGSGGASGNPQSRGGVVRSGYGGGGGGAISVFGRRVERLEIRARGGFADRSNVDVRGGHGSGGAVIVNSKDELRSVLYDVDRQIIQSTPSGLGRGRQSAFGSMTVVDPIGDSRAPFIGPVTDTTNLIRRRFPIGYTGAGSNGNEDAILDFYIKPEGLNKNWVRVASIDNYTQGQRKIDTLNLNDFPEFSQDSIFYLVVVQNTRESRWGNQGSPYLHNPRAIMSQSAANILKVSVRPRLLLSDVPDTIRAVNCGNGIVLQSTFTIANGGNDTLRLTNWRFSSNNANTNPQLNLPLVPGVLERTSLVMQQESTIGTIRYNIAPNRFGVIRDTLIIEHNDPALSESPLRLPFVFIADSVRTDLSANLRGGRYRFNRDTLDIGKICFQDSATVEIYIENRSSVNIVLGERSSDNLSGTLRENLRLANPVIRTSPGDSVILTGSVTPTSMGRFVRRLIVSFDPCDRRDTIFIAGEAVRVELNAIATRQHGSVRIGDSRIVQYSLRNDGTTDAFVDFPALTPPFSYVPPVNSPVQIPPATTFEFGVQYTPTALRNDTFPLRISTANLPGACTAEAEILLAGRGVETDLFVSKPDMDFGEILRCFTTDDTVFVLNRGGIPITLTTAATIAGAAAADFAIISPQPLPVNQTLQENDRVDFIVRFQPTTTIGGLKEAVLIIPTNDPAAEFVEIPLSARQAEFAEVSPTIIDFGTRNIGDPVVSQVLRLTNPSGVPLDIRNVAIVGIDEVTVTPENLVIAPGATEELLLTLTPTRDGIRQGQIIVTYDNPCEDTQQLPLQYVGRAGSVALQNIVAFGRVPFCIDSAEVLELRSTGAAPIDIVEQPQLAGADAASFRLILPDVVFPLTLEPDQTYTFTVEYIGDQPEAVETASILVNARINGVEQELVVQLEGRRSPSFALAPEREMFIGEVSINREMARRLTIRNTAPTPITIRNILFAEGVHFELRPNIINAVIEVGGEISAEVVFAPQVLDELTDVLSVVIDEAGCIEQRDIDLRGIGLPGTQVAVWLPDTTVAPTLLNFRLPVYAIVLSDDDEVEGGDFDMEIRFNSSLFFPQRVVAGDGSRPFAATFRREGADRVVAFSGTNVSVPRDTIIIAYIEGATLLGDAASTPLIISSMSWAGGSPEIRSQDDGTLTIEICEEGGQRLLRSNTVRMRLRPSPATEHVVCTIENVPPGQYMAELYSLEGRLLRSLQGENIGAGESTLELRIMVQDLPSGSYRLMLKTPSGVLSEPLLIVR